MSGIAGIINLKERGVDRGLLEKMADPLKKRGPDGLDFELSNAVGLLHAHLAIDHAQKEPFTDPETGNIVILNGTIYNQHELRRELEAKGFTFRTNADAEVILYAYRAWGMMEAASRFRGVFAFALWDKNANKMHLVRDRMGAKPLYVAKGKTGEQIYFASNTQSLLATGDINTEINPIALHFMYTLHAVVPAPYTIFEGIQKVHPAHIMTIDALGNMTETRYWTLSAVREHADWEYEDWKEAVESTLSDAVDAYMGFSDEPVGVLLSGGLDSTLITALAIEKGHDKIQTFSVGFEDTPEEEGSEFRFSDQFVAKYQTDHHKFQVPNEKALTRLPDAIKNMSEPLFGQDAIGFYLLSEQVKSVTSVVQSGQGADEVFAGYFWYPLMHESTESDPLKRFSQYYFDRPHSEWLTAFNEKYHVGDVTGDFIRDKLVSPGADTFLDSVLRLDATTLIVDDPVKRVDNMTMAHGLEARMPFMDHKLVELAMAMPPEYKLAQQGKGILKDIARGRVPDSIIDRPKAYFPMPALKYVRGEFLEMMRDTLTSQKAKERGIFNAGYLENLLNHPEAESSFTNIKGSKLWHCALLELWLQSVGQ